MTNCMQGCFVSSHHNFCVYSFHVLCVSCVTRSFKATSNDELKWQLRDSRCLKMHLGLYLCCWPFASSAHFFMQPFTVNGGVSVNYHPGLQLWLCYWTHTTKEHAGSRSCFTLLAGRGDAVEISFEKTLSLASPCICLLLSELAAVCLCAHTTSTLPWPQFVWFYPCLEATGKKKKKRWPRVTFHPVLRKPRVTGWGDDGKWRDTGERVDEHSCWVS